MNIVVKNCSLAIHSDEGSSAERGDIAIENGHIRSVGAVPENFTAEKIIDARGSLALPGLVNSHTHVSMSLLRNLADDLELMDWLQNKIWPIEAKMGPEEVYIGASLSMIEMIRSGITAFADMYFDMDQVAKAATEAGIRANCAVGLTGDQKAACEKLKVFRDFHSAYHGSGNGLVQVDIGPHAPYTCDDGCMEEAAKAAADLGCGVHIHLSETEGEVRECKEKYGISPIQLAEKTGLFEGRAIAAHCVFVDDTDIEILARKGVHVVHNPTSNLKLASGFAPVARMIDAGVDLAIGTDGPSSNNNQNMLEEIHLSAILAKAVARNPKALPAPQALEVASRGGSRALGLEEKSGSIEAGAPADLFLLSTEGSHMQPLNDPIAAVVYGAAPSDIHTVICAGNPLMQDGKMLHLDEEAILKEARNVMKRLRS